MPGPYVAACYWERGYCEGDFPCIQPTGKANHGAVSVNPNAAANFYRAVRDFALTTKPWETAAYYETKPDEMYDLSLVSARVYGRRDEYLAVMAAAGIDMFDQPLQPGMKLVMPTDGQLLAIKRATGFESLSGYRNTDGSPTWEP